MFPMFLRVFSLCSPLISARLYANIQIAKISEKSAADARSGPSITQLNTPASSVCLHFEYLKWSYLDCLQFWMMMTMKKPSCTREATEIDVEFCKDCQRCIFVVLNA